jgi:diguanylate cyclase (GGDEF)-like protein
MSKDLERHARDGNQQLNADYLALVRKETLWTEPLNAALEHITQAVSASLGVRRVGIWLLRHEPESITEIKVYSADTQTYSDGRRILGESCPSYLAAIDAERVIAASDARTDFRTRELSSGYMIPLGIGAILDAPLRIAGRTRGVLCIEHVGQARIWNEEEKRFAMSIGDLIAQLMALDELRRSEARLLERNESLRLVNELSRRLHGRLDLDSILEQAANALLGISGATDVGVFLLDPTGEYLRLALALGPNQELSWKLPVMPVADTLSGAALRERRLMISTDFSTDERMHPQARALLVAHGINAGLMIPLYHGDKPLGTISLAFRQQRRFNALELETLEAIGNTLSLAVMNAGQVKELEYSALHDSLTGLPNRLAWHQWFETRSGAADATARVGLLLLDLDRFKEVNDTLGHHVGDRLLCEVAHRLQAAVAGYSALLCRLGGDEFAIALADVGEEEAKAAGQELLASLRRPFLVEEMPLEIGASMGIALYPRDGMDSHGLLRSADVAMYAAKRASAGLTVYDPQLDTHTPDRLAMIVDLGPAIREGQLCMHFQPKFSFHSANVVGFEALVRWQHPRLGLLYPESFLPLAEMSEAIHGLTHRVISLALAQQREWKMRGRHYSVAVNLSARNLIDDRCVDGIEQLLREYGASPGDLELEITETALMHDPEGARVLLDRIAALGVILSIDDFGTGYSSLGYLRRLPIQTLKIDRAFVTDMARNEQDAVIVRSTIALAHNLNLRVVAEGVEDARTQALLREMGCDQAQGNYFSKPLPWAEVEAWLETITQ